MLLTGLRRTEDEEREDEVLGLEEEKEDEREDEEEDEEEEGWLDPARPESRRL